MRLTVYTADIREAMKFAVKCAAVKPMTPILAAVKLTAEDGKLTIETNSFKVAAKVVIPASVEMSGSVAVDAKLLTDIIAQFDKNSTVSFSLEENRLRAESEGTVYNMLTFGVNDFPPPKFNFDNSIEIRSAAMNCLIRSSLFAVDTKNGEQPIFKGVNFALRDNQLFGVATNSHQAVQVYDFIKSNDGDANFNVIVPAQACEIIASNMCDFYENILTVAANGNVLCVKTANLAFSTQLIEGEFPTLEKILCEEHPIEVVFKVAEMKNALRQLSIISKNTEYDTVTFAISPQQISISSESDALGSAKKVIEAVTPDDIDLTISFNYNYLLGMLNSVDAKELHAHFSGKVDPVRFDILDRNDFVYIITPVRT